ncbi:MAG: cellulase family glycosylhydrolase [Sedimentisphaerales bacterium]|nr:cellulase family glycosylhydrolase [Sedimentisphaerales bacterium]
MIKSTQKILIIVVILFITFWGTPDQTEGAVDITSISQNKSVVGQYEKFEITFVLSQTYSNPFDPDIIDIQVSFSQPDGTKAVIPAFFYRDYEIIRENPETYINPGLPQWKARFAPTKVGMHTFDITITDVDGTTTKSAAGSFVCQEKNHRGFIRINKNDPLMFQYDDGSTRFNIGHDIAWRRGGVKGWQDSMTKMGNAGENWVRLWMCQYGGYGAVLLEEKHRHETDYYEGVGRLSMQAALRLDQFVESAEKNGVAIQLALQHHGQFSTRANSKWDLNPYNIIYAESDGGFLKNAEDFFTDPQARRLTRNKYRYIVARWGYSPAIFAWELFNEVQFTEAWENKKSDTVINWHKEMADYIRSIDPYKHLITTSSHGGGFDQIWKQDSIDVIQVHYYGSNIIGYFKDTATNLAAFGKPVIIGEFGSAYTPGVGNPEGSTEQLPEPYRTQMLEALPLHNGIWTTFHVKSSAHLWWWDNYIQPRNLYGQFTALAVYAEGENLADYNLSAAPKALTGNAPFYANPVISDFWGISSQKVFTQKNNLFPGMDNLSQWLQGSTQPKLMSNPTFHINMPDRGKFIIHVQNVSQAFKNSLRVLVDSREVFASDYENNASNFTITVPLAAGPQSVQVENTGEDWFRITSYEFTPDNPALLNSIGLAGRDRAYIWIYDIGSQYGKKDNGTIQNESLILPGLADGAYEVQIYKTRGPGGIMQSDIAQSVDGKLSYPLPPFEKDIAVKIKPAK